ncbi:MAG TPA: hypothetical protein VFP36_06040, partial [Usitatibacter sp.]|nr:hypothetical protein [Usitatibacter sp.]
LVCGIAGFPVHALATGGREQVGFVIRRMLKTPGAAGADPAVEHAFVKRPEGGAEWKAVNGAALVDGEEMLPLFPVSFADDSGHPRRLLAGVIPVGRREEYMGTGYSRAAGGGTNGGAANTSAVSAHKEQLKVDVAEPWKNLIRMAFATLDKTVKDEGAAPPAGKSLREVRRALARSMNRQLQMQSWLLLLDFADYLAAHLPDVWNAVANDAPESTFTAQSPQDVLYRWLGAATMSDGLKRACDTSPSVKPFAVSLRDALRRVAAANVRKGLEGAQALYTAGNEADAAWPGFQFLLAGIAEDDDNTHNDAVYHFTLEGPYRSLASATATVEEGDKEAAPGTLGAAADTDLLDTMVALVVKAIDPAKASSPPPLPFAATLQRALRDLGDDPGWFVIRCMHVRCDCGPLRPVLASAPTQRFQLASFFDPDAPARPVRIALPLDTTPAGLRKFDKNAALMVSDVLCGQIARAKGLGFVDLVRQVLPWPLHKDIDVGDMGPCQSTSGSIGMICSLSIPIVTLCALILLLIIVSLLDFIFRWMPYLVMCFPIPSLKAKKPPGAP